MQMGSQKTAASINMTPMIDILLVLLIIAMVVPNRSKGLPSEVPEPAPESPRTEPDRLDAVLHIRKDRAIELESKQVLLLELEGRLKSLFVMRPGGVLFIDGSPDLEYADVATVIDIARGAGWTRVGLLTEKPGP